MAMQSQASVPPTNLSHQGRLRGCSSLGRAVRAQSQREDLWEKDFRGCHEFQKAVGRLQGLMGMAAAGFRAEQTGWQGRWYSRGWMPGRAGLSLRYEMMKTGLQSKCLPQVG